EVDRVRHLPVNELAVGQQDAVRLRLEVGHRRQHVHVEGLARVVERPAALALAPRRRAVGAGGDEGGDAGADVGLQLLLRRRLLLEVAATDEVHVVLGAGRDRRHHRPEANRPLWVDDAAGRVVVPVVGEPVAEVLVAVDGALVDVERNVEVSDRRLDELVELGGRVRGDHQVPAFARGPWSGWNGAASWAAKTDSKVGAKKRLWWDA